MIIQVFSNSMIFPCMELFLVIFHVFHDFQSLWEPWALHFVESDLDPNCLQGYQQTSIVDRVKVGVVFRK